MKLYLFYSNDKSIIEEEINKIKVNNNIDDNNIIKYDLENNLENIIEEASMNSMFGDKKLIIINITFKEEINIDNLEKYFQNYNKNSYILFIHNTDKIDTRKKIYKIIDKYGKVNKLINDNNHVKDYIKNYIKDYKMDINYFISKINNNIDNIKNELDKLMMYKVNDKNITNDDIDDLIITNIEEEIFSLSDSVIHKDNNKSILLYRNFMTKGYEPIQIIGLLASQFQFLYQVKRLYNMNKTNDEIAKILEVHPYRVKLAIQNSYYYSERELLNKIYKLANLDKDIKLSNIDKFVGLELFLVSKD